MSNYLREISTARVDSIHLEVVLTDGCTLTVPLAFFPTLLLASQEERDELEVTPYSLHWDSLDCDLGIEGLLQGAKEHPKLAEKARRRADRQEPVGAE